MSITNQPLGAKAQSIPTGVQISAYSSYEEAQRAVDHLSDNDHDVRLVSIVGEDLRLVERITGRLDYGKVAGSGALTGAWFGLMMALVMWLVIGNFGLVDFVIPVLVGAAFGVLLGIVSYAVRPKTRDFTSASTVVAKRYVVIAGPTAADEMRAALSSAGLIGDAPATTARAQAAPSGAGGPAGPHGGGAYGAGAQGAGGAAAGVGGAAAGGGQDAWTPGARGTGSAPGEVQQDTGVEDQPGRPAPTGFAPGVDGTPRYGARLEDLTPEQRAHAEAQLREADEHRGAAENRPATEAGGPDQP
ncbi:general stress protein [Georgenia sp. Z1491]|uniref:general stress protein n=1 Tax=Georgenia sp. Z1491 TaxID=3416707 RepID=UPI003CEBCFC9